MCSGTRWPRRSLFNGCPIGHIKALLGHERLETTCRYYVGLDVRAARMTPSSLPLAPACSDIGMKLSSGLDLPEVAPQILDEVDFPASDDALSPPGSGPRSITSKGVNLE
jgi:hypothetical protein